MQISTQQDEVLRRAAVATGVSNRRILCATDLTARSERAMQRAALLARQINAEVLFVHAVSDKLFGRALRMKVNRAYARLTSESERVMKHAPHDATVTVQLGQPLDVVIAAAHDYNPHLIVMARPTRRRLDAIFGTTAERVIRGTDRSVLVVSDTAERAYERVVLATDLSSTSAHVTRTVVDMGMLKNAQACVVHAFELPYHNIATAKRFTPAEVSTHQEEWHSAVKRDVLSNLSDAGVDLAGVHLSIEQARPLTAIRRAMDRARPELLVIGVSRWFALKRVLVGSVADQVFRSVNCDVLAIAPSPVETKWRSAA